MLICYDSDFKVTEVDANKNCHDYLTSLALASANQTVTILYKMLYNSYNIVTSYQFVQSVQSVQLHLLILYKRFHKMLYNSSEKVLN